MAGTYFEFNRVTFALPTQSFKVTAFISAEERLPAVTEFVLRLLHTCGQVSLHGFRDYFGFSEAEALSVIESLSRQGYICLNDESVALSEQSLARFEASPDEYPWVTKLKKRTDMVPFDLLAFTPLRRTDFVYATDNWIKLNPAADVVGSSVARARQAYRENFSQIERDSSRRRGEERERSFGVHSVENVEARKPSFIPLTLTLSVDQTGRYVTTLPEEFERGAKPELLSNFQERVSDEFENQAFQEPINVEGFIDFFQLDFLRQYVLGSHFDIPKYAEDVQRGLLAPKGIQAIYGNIYLQNNAELVAAQIADARMGKKGFLTHTTSLAWLAPDYLFWGRGGDFISAVEMLGKALKIGPNGDEVYVFDYAEERQENLVRSKYSNTGVNELHLIRTDHIESVPWANSLELMLYPGRFAVALLHLQLDGCSGVRVPVGFLTDKPHHLRLIHRLISERTTGSRYAGRWGPKKQGQKNEERRTMAQACGFLAYSHFDPSQPVDLQAGQRI